MAGDDKLAYVKEGLILMVDELDEKDILSIVTYESITQVLLPPQPVTDKDAIKELIAGLFPSGGTNLYGGMMLGYEQVEKNLDEYPEAHHRVILLSDGLANQGEITSTGGIVSASKPFNEKGIGITTVGVGTDFNFDLMYALANQGHGNFYFIDSPGKLLDVFVEEIKYLLTPVAESLKIWFRLPGEFGVDAIYGFEFTQIGDEFVILGPEAQYDVTPEDEPGNPDTGNEGKVSVSTVFASKKNGIVMVKIKTPGLDALEAQQNLDFASIYYTYTLVKEGTEEKFGVEVPMETFSYHDGEGGFEYFTNDIVQRNFCILQMALAMKNACSVFHGYGDDTLEVAQEKLSHAAAKCALTLEGLTEDGWSEKYLEPMEEDLDVLLQLKENMDAGALPANGGEDAGGSGEW